MPLPNARKGRPGLRRHYDNLDGGPFQEHERYPGENERGKGRVLRDGEQHSAVDAAKRNQGAKTSCGQPNPVTRQAGGMAKSYQDNVNPTDKYYKRVQLLKYVMAENIKGEAEVE